MKRILLVAVLLVLVAGVVGGSVTWAKVGGGSQEGDGGGVVIGLAPIHEVRVNMAESFPPQVFVYIKGGLADGCTTFHQLTTERDENTINIKVTTQRPKDAVCIQVYGYFEKNVALGSDFTSGETYTINVNDKTTSFVMQ